MTKKPKPMLEAFVKPVPAPAVHTPAAVDPAVRATRVANKMREYYEVNRPHWWGAGPPGDGLPDVLMLGLLHIVLSEYK